MSFLQKMMGKNSKKDKNRGRNVEDKGLKLAASLSSSSTASTKSTVPPKKSEVQAQTTSPTATIVSTTPPPAAKLKGKKSRSPPMATTSTQVNATTKAINSPSSNTPSQVTVPSTAQPDLNGRPKTENGESIQSHNLPARKVFESVNDATVSVPGIPSSTTDPVAEFKQAFPEMASGQLTAKPVMQEQIPVELEKHNNMYAVENLKKELEFERSLEDGLEKLETNKETELEKRELNDQVRQLEVHEKEAENSSSTTQVKSQNETEVSKEEEPEGSLLDDSPPQLEVHAKEEIISSTPREESLLITTCQNTVEASHETEVSHSKTGDHAVLDATLQELDSKKPLEGEMLKPKEASVLLGIHQDKTDAHKIIAADSITTEEKHVSTYLNQGQEPDGAVELPDLNQQKDSWCLGDLLVQESRLQELDAKIGSIEQGLQQDKQQEPQDTNLKQVQISAHECSKTSAPHEDKSSNATGKQKHEPEVTCTTVQDYAALKLPTCVKQAESVHEICVLDEEKPLSSDHIMQKQESIEQAHTLLLQGSPSLNVDEHTEQKPELVDVPRHQDDGLRELEILNMSLHEGVAQVVLDEHLGLPLSHEEQLSHAMLKQSLQLDKLSGSDREATIHERENDVKEMDLHTEQEESSMASSLCVHDKMFLSPDANNVLSKFSDSTEKDCASSHTVDNDCKVEETTVQTLTLNGNPECQEMQSQKMTVSVMQQPAQNRDDAPKNVEKKIEWAYISRQLQPGVTGVQKITTQEAKHTNVQQERCEQSMMPTYVDPEDTVSCGKQSDMQKLKDTNWEPEQLTHEVSLSKEQTFCVSNEIDTQAGDDVLATANVFTEREDVPLDTKEYNGSDQSTEKTNHVGDENQHCHEIGPSDTPLDMNIKKEQIMDVDVQKDNIQELETAISPEKILQVHGVQEPNAINEFQETQDICHVPMDVEVQKDNIQELEMASSPEQMLQVDEVQEPNVIDELHETRNICLQQEELAYKVQPVQNRLSGDEEQPIAVVDGQVHELGESEEGETDAATSEATCEDKFEGDESKRPPHPADSMIQQPASIDVSTQIGEARELGINYITRHQEEAEILSIQEKLQDQGQELEELARTIEGQSDQGTTVQIRGEQCSAVKGGEKDDDELNGTGVHKQKSQDEVLDQHTKQGENDLAAFQSSGQFQIEACNNDLPDFSQQKQAYKDKDDYKEHDQASFKKEQGIHALDNSHFSVMEEGKPSSCQKLQLEELKGNAAGVDDQQDAVKEQKVITPENEWEITQSAQKPPQNLDAILMKADNNVLIKSTVVQEVQTCALAKETSHPVDASKEEPSSANEERIYQEVQQKKNCVSMDSSIKKQASNFTNDQPKNAQTPDEAKDDPQLQMIMGSTLGLEQEVRDTQIGLACGEEVLETRTDEQVEQVQMLKNSFEQTQSKISDSQQAYDCSDIVKNGSEIRNCPEAIPLKQQSIDNVRWKEETQEQIEMQQAHYEKQERHTTPAEHLPVPDSEQMCETKENEGKNEEPELKVETNMFTVESEDESDATKKGNCTLRQLDESCSVIEAEQLPSNMESQEHDYEPQCQLPATVQELEEIKIKEEEIEEMIEVPNVPEPLSENRATASGDTYPLQAVVQQKSMCHNNCMDEMEEFKAIDDVIVTKQEGKEKETNVHGVAVAVHGVKCDLGQLEETCPVDLLPASNREFQEHDYEPQYKLPGTVEELEGTEMEEEESVGQIKLQVSNVSDLILEHCIAVSGNTCISTTGEQESTNENDYMDRREMFEAIDAAIVTKQQAKENKSDAQDVHDTKSELAQLKESCTIIEADQLSAPNREIQEHDHEPQCKLPSSVEELDDTEMKGEVADMQFKLEDTRVPDPISETSTIVIGVKYISATGEQQLMNDNNCMGAMEVIETKQQDEEKEEAGLEPTAPQAVDVHGVSVAPKEQKVNEVVYAADVPHNKAYEIDCNEKNHVSANVENPKAPVQAGTTQAVSKNIGLLSDDTSGANSTKEQIEVPEEASCLIDRTKVPGEVSCSTGDPQEPPSSKPYESENPKQEVADMVTFEQKQQCQEGQLLTDLPHEGNSCSEIHGHLYETTELEVAKALYTPPNEADLRHEDNLAINVSEHQNGRKGLEMAHESLQVDIQQDWKHEHDTMELEVVNEPLDQDASLVHEHPSVDVGEHTKDLEVEDESLNLDAAELGEPSDVNVGHTYGEHRSVDVGEHQNDTKELEMVNMPLDVHPEKDRKQQNEMDEHEVAKEPLERDAQKDGEHQNELKELELEKKPLNDNTQEDDQNETAANKSLHGNAGEHQSIYVDKHQNDLNNLDACEDVGYQVQVTTHVLDESTKMSTIKNAPVESIDVKDELEVTDAVHDTDNTSHGFKALEPEKTDAELNCDKNFITPLDTVHGNFCDKQSQELTSEPFNITSTTLKAALKQKTTDEERTLKFRNVPLALGQESRQDMEVEQVEDQSQMLAFEQFNKSKSQEASTGCQTPEGQEQLLNAPALFKTEIKSEQSTQQSQELDCEQFVESKPPDAAQPSRDHLRPGEEQKEMKLTDVLIDECNKESRVKISKEVHEQSHEEVHEQSQELVCKQLSTSKLEEPSYVSFSNDKPTAHLQKLNLMNEMIALNQESRDIDFDCCEVACQQYAACEHLEGEQAATCNSKTREEQELDVPPQKREDFKQRYELTYEPPKTSLPQDIAQAPIHYPKPGEEKQEVELIDVLVALNQETLEIEPEQLCKDHEFATKESARKHQEEGRALINNQKPWEKKQEVELIDVLVALNQENQVIEPEQVPAQIHERTCGAFVAMQASTDNEENGKEEQEVGLADVHVVMKQENQEMSSNQVLFTSPSKQIFETEAIQQVETSAPEPEQVHASSTQEEQHSAVEIQLKTLNLADKMQGLDIEIPAKASCPADEKAEVLGVAEDKKDVESTEVDEDKGGVGVLQMTDAVSQLSITASLDGDEQQSRKLDAEEEKPSHKLECNQNSPRSEDVAQQSCAAQVERFDIQEVRAKIKQEPKLDEEENMSQSFNEAAKDTGDSGLTCIEDDKAQEMNVKPGLSTEPNKEFCDSGLKPVTEITNLLVERELDSKEISVLPKDILALLPGTI